MFLLLTGFCFAIGLQAQETEKSDTVKIGNITIIKKDDGKSKGSSSNDTEVKIEKKKSKGKSTNWGIVDGHVKGAVNMPLIEMTDMARVAQLEDHLNIYVHCAGGYRSVIGASMLKRQGIHNLRNVEGGWAKIKDQKGIEVEKVQAALN